MELERADRYRERAAELLALADRAPHEQQRRLLVELAATYHRLAEQIEKTKRNL